MTSFPKARARKVIKPEMCIPAAPPHSLLAQLPVSARDKLTGTSDTTARVPPLAPKCRAFSSLPTACHAHISDKEKAPELPSPLTDHRAASAVRTWPSPLASGPSAGSARSEDAVRVVHNCAGGDRSTEALALTTLPGFPEISLSLLPLWGGSWRGSSQPLPLGGAMGVCPPPAPTQTLPALFMCKVTRF